MVQAVPKRTIRMVPKRAIQAVPKRTILAAHKTTIRRVPRKMTRIKRRTQIRRRTRTKRRTRTQKTTRTKRRTRSKSAIQVMIRIKKMAQTTLWTMILTAPKTPRTIPKKALRLAPQALALLEHTNA